MSTRHDDRNRTRGRCPEAVRYELEQRLFDSLDYYEGSPARVGDVGCGDGRGTARLQQRWRGAQVTALDSSPAFLRRARRNAGWWKPFARVCAGASELPFADRAIDVVYSNLCLPWGGAAKDVFREFARVLRPGGFLVASSLGPDTLLELRAACEATGVDPPHGPLPDMHDVGDAALAAGLKDPVLDTDRLTVTFPDVPALWAEVAGIGTDGSEAGADFPGVDAARLAAVADAYGSRRDDGRIAATFEVVTLHAWGFPEGALPLFGGRETRFEVVSRRVPRRRPQDDAGGV